MHNYINIDINIPNLFFGYFNSFFDSDLIKQHNL